MSFLIIVLAPILLFAQHVDLHRLKGRYFAHAGGDYFKSNENSCYYAGHKPESSYQVKIKWHKKFRYIEKEENTRYITKLGIIKLKRNYFVLRGRWEIIGDSIYLKTRNKKKFMTFKVQDEGTYLNRLGQEQRIYYLQNTVHILRRKY
jgi:hypothetical protein